MNFKNRYMFSRNSEAGLTLLEVLVVTIILGILVIPIFQTVLVNKSITKKSTERIEAKDATVMVQKYIVDNVRMAQTVEVNSTVPTPSTSIQNLYIKDGGLYHVNKNVAGVEITRHIYEKNLLGNFDIEVVFNKIDDRKLELTVEACEPGTSTSLYKQNTQINIINMKTDIIDNTIQGTSGSCISYIVP